MREKWGGAVISLVAIAIFASNAFAECPEGKEPVDITTPSGITKTLCIPAAAVQGIENAAEHSGGTIVASNCPCFSKEDVEAVAALGDFNCARKAVIDIDGNVSYENYFCTAINIYKEKGTAQVTYDISTVNSCYYSYPGDKYSGLPPVTLKEIISDSEYDTCVNILSSVDSPK